MEYGLQTKLHAMLYIVAHHCDGLFVGLCKLQLWSDSSPIGWNPARSYTKVIWETSMDIYQKCQLHLPTVLQWRIKKFWEGEEGRNTMYQPRRHLSQMHTTNYMPFIWKKAAYWKNLRPIGAWAPQTPLNLPLCCTVLQTSCHPYSRSFRVAAAKIWNAVPSNVVPASSHKFPPVQRSSCCEHFIPWQPW